MNAIYNCDLNKENFHLSFFLINVAVIQLQVLPQPQTHLVTPAFECVKNRESVTPYHVFDLASFFFPFCLQAPLPLI